MLVNFPFLSKLWDKGIDITSSVITSLIVTVIALLGWRLKLHFDLKAEEAKQRQQHRIARELSLPETLAGQQRLRSELDGYIERLNSSVGNPERMQDTWNGFVQWLEKSNLAHRPQNQQIMAGIAWVGKNLKDTSYPEKNLPGSAKVLTDAIRNIELF